MTAAPGLRLVALLYIAGVLFFLLFPIVLIIPMSLTAGDTVDFSVTSFSLRWYQTFLTEERWVSATVLSTRVAAASSVIATVIGTLAALAMVRGRPPARSFWRGLLLAPLLMPSIILALGVFILFSRLGWLESVPALIGVHAMLAVPVVYLTVSSALAQSDSNLERAARAHGANAVQAFLHVTLPGIASAVAAGAIFAFFVSFDDLALALFVMGGKPTLPMLVWGDLRFQFSPVVIAASTVLVLVNTIGFSTLALLSYARSSASTAAEA